MSQHSDRIITSRLVLRRFESRDVPGIVRELGNWNVARWLGRVPHPYVARHAHRWLARSVPAWDAGHDFTLAIVKRGGPDQIMGAVGAHNLHQREQPCGYWLAERHWGRGYMSEAIGAILDALYREKPDARPIATALPANRASINVLQNAGFVRDFRQSNQFNAASRRKMRVLHFTYAGKGAVTAAAKEASSPP